MKKYATILLAVILSLLSFVPSVLAANSEVYYEFANYSMMVTCELKGDYPKNQKFVFETVAKPDENSPNFKENTIKVPANTTQTFGVIEADKPDTYSYIVSQKVGNDNKITYDKTQYEVVVDIISNGEGLIAENHTITNLTTKEKVEEIRFINIYESKSPKTGDDNNLLFWEILLIAFSVAGVVCFIALKKTKKKADLK